MIRNESSEIPRASNLSVATCTFNGARFLAQRLESIQNQVELDDI